jgi:hypothetical protein
MSQDQQLVEYRVTLSRLGFHVQAADGTFVAGHSASGCRHIGDVPTWAARCSAQAVADDLNADES